MPEPMQTHTHELGKTDFAFAKHSHRDRKPSIHQQLDNSLGMHTKSFSRGLLFSHWAHTEATKSRRKCTYAHIRNHHCRRLVLCSNAMVTASTTTTATATAYHTEKTELSPHPRCFWIHISSSKIVALFLSHVWCLGVSVCLYVCMCGCTLAMLLFSARYCYSLLKILVVPLPQNTSNHIFEHSAKGIQQFFFCSHSALSFPIQSIRYLWLVGTAAAHVAVGFFSRYVCFGSVRIYSYTQTQTNNVNVFDGRCEFQKKIT